MLRRIKRFPKSIFNFFQKTHPFLLCRSCVRSSVGRGMVEQEWRTWTFSVFSKYSHHTSKVYIIFVKLILRFFLPLFILYKYSFCWISAVVHSIYLCLFKFKMYHQNVKIKLWIKKINRNVLLKKWVNRIIISLLPYLSCVHGISYKLRENEYIGMVKSWSSSKNFALFAKMFQKLYISF